MLISDKWENSQYELLDAGDGEKLENWGGHILRRPDPTAVWRRASGDETWNRADAFYHRSNTGGGSWEYIGKLPNKWSISYGDNRFLIRPTTFKHTGLFPEQAVNWDWMAEKILSSSRDISVLNLFAYTGGATVACAAAGAEVCHVDAAKGMVDWAKDNLKESGLADRKVRFLVDDCFKFVQREQRRGNRYDAIIMDPPSYGRGPGGEVWKLEDAIGGFLDDCARLLSDDPLFLLVNAYTTGFSARVLQNLLSVALDGKRKGSILSEEIGIPIKSSGLILPCGISARWEAAKG